LGPNLRLFAAKNVRGVFEQGAYQSWGSEMAELRAWVLAKLLWDPRRDPDELREEFLNGYYGPAAGVLDDFLETLERALARSGDALGCYSPPDAKFLSLATLTRARRLLDRAEGRARRSAEYVRRVRRAALSVDYVVLARWEELREEARRSNVRWPWPETRAALLERFLATARREGVTMISEGTTLEAWAGNGGRKK
jgi:hypothetical protein